MRKAAFFDRDGVINVDSGYLIHVSDFKWIDGARESVKKAQDLGYLTILVTNQSGIARGLYTESDFMDLTRWMQDQLAEVGAKFDAVYYCPHLPEGSVAEYARDCDCRKPKPGMLKQAIQEHDIDVEHSFLVGDSERDIQAANAVGVNGFLFNGGNLVDFLDSSQAWES